MTDITKLYFNDIRGNRGLSKEETRETALLAQKGCEAAKEKLVRNHLLLVAKIARQYANKGVEFNDLLAEGNSGLMQAIEKWDSTKGSSFTTAASWWIKAVIIRNCMHGNRIVRLPEHVSELWRTGRLPDFTYGEVNIDKPNDEGNTLADSLPEKEIDIFANEDRIKAQNKLEKVLKYLKPKEKTVITLFYGLFGKEDMTVPEIAEQLNLTTTRINQLLRSSMKVMQEHKEEIV